MTKTIDFTRLSGTWLDQTFIDAAAIATTPMIGQIINRLRDYLNYDNIDIAWNGKIYAYQGAPANSADDLIDGVYCGDFWSLAKQYNREQSINL